MVEIECVTLLGSILFIMKWKYILRIIFIGVVLYLSIVYLDGITLLPINYGIIPSFLLLFGIFAVIEVLIYPIMKILILPLRLITFGFASAVLSVNLVYVIAWLYPFLEITSFLHALILGLGFGVARLLTK